MPKKDWSKRWKRVSEWWGKLNPPWTPSIGEYKIYETYFKQVTDSKNKQRSLLILGATALLRELGEKYGYQITLLDINPEMIQKQTRFLEHKISKEKVVIGDWLKMDKLLKGQQFDIIAGDHSVINVKFKDWPRLYQNCQKLLKPNGYIFWTTTVYTQRKYITLNKCLKNFRFTDSVIERFLRSYKLFGNPEFHDKNYGFHFGKLNKVFEKEARKTLTPEQIKNFQLEITEDWVSTILPQKKFEEFTKRYFKIVNRKYDKSHPFFKYQQLYLLKKKNRQKNN
ncbi:methyltransferase domain-containing protein [Patescibacteria group bacterium]|nr:methyltransferase domain-containing protein [Patescibacteria group bacterium]